jgi:2-aminoethylphosphonate-pyruvate transaminase
VNAAAPQRDKILFTPGPLTTSATVKQAMLRDLGSRDAEFIGVVREIRAELLRVAGVAGQPWEAVLLQGSGTFGLEAVVGTALPRGGRLLVLVNGAYGQRLVRIARVLGIDVLSLETPEDQPPDPVALDVVLGREPTLTHVALVHCETTTGILNPVEPLAAVVQRHRRALILDAMSSFGAVPVNLPAWGVDWMVSSANKCVEGVPGFALVLR